MKDDITKVTKTEAMNRSWGLNQKESRQVIGIINGLIDTIEEEQLNRKQMSPIAQAIMQKIRSMYPEITKKEDLHKLGFKEEDCVLYHNPTYVIVGSSRCPNCKGFIGTMDDY